MNNPHNKSKFQLHQEALQRIRDKQAKVRAEQQERACARCEYMVLQLIGPHDLERKMVCKRFPPNITNIHTPQGLMSITAHPVVNAGQWCFEFKASQIPPGHPDAVSEVLSS